jgi:hypothetical protein
MAIMNTLFDLTGEALHLQRQINESAELLFSDDPEEAAAATAQLETLIAFKSGNRQALKSKADAWCWCIDHLRAEANARSSHAQRLAELATSAAHQADVLQDRLIQALQKVAPDETHWDLPEHKITSRRSQAVEVTAKAVDLPGRFQRLKIEISADKTALAAALKGGAQIEGVALVERRSWSIK